MASLMEKAAQRWNNIFSTASAANELAAIGASTQDAINDSVRKINQDSNIQQSLTEALNFQNSPSYSDNINILSYEVSLKCNATAIFVKSDHDILFISFDQTMSN